MSYKEKGAGGERLNAGDLNEMINKFHMKAKMSFSNKKLNPGTQTLVRVKGDIIHFLLESIETSSFYDNGEPTEGPDNWRTGASVPSGIQDVVIKNATDLTATSHIVEKVVDNLSNEKKIYEKEFEGFTVEYWYTYAVVSIAISVADANDLYVIEGFTDLSGIISTWESTTLRVSYGGYNKINTPYAAQNKELDVNMSLAVSQAFDEKAMLIMEAGSDGKNDWGLGFGRALLDQKIRNFKLLVINDNSSNSGMLIGQPATSGRGGLELVSSSITNLSTGRYLHELIYSYERDYNEAYYEGSTESEFYYPYLRGDSTYDFQGAAVLWPNSLNEYGDFFPKYIDSISSGSPLTNILLSYMTIILRHSIYNYGPQNYTPRSGNFAYLSNSIDASRRSGVLNGAYNTHLTLAGAFYHLANMTDFNDDTFVSWNIQYIK